MTVPRFARLALGAVAVLALSLGGCGGDNGGGEDVATAADASTKADSAQGDQNTSGDIAEKARQFAACMREQGIGMPDPEVAENGDGRGGVIFNAPGAGSGGGAAPDKAKVEAAHKKCQHLLPNGGDDIPQADPEMEERARAMAKCMRDNGVPNFPDPEPGGGIRLEPGSGLDPRDPTFQEAQKKCHEQVGLPGDGPRLNENGGSTGGGQ
jgi:hypothetical protein